jgi:signal transduction histidine kinase
MMQESLQIHMGSIRQTTKETQKRNEELVRAMKMAEVAVKQKTLFIQNVSHQIRTPLNIIQGFANVLRDSLSPSEKEKNALSEEELANITEMMKHNASHLNRMVLMLYDSSEIGTSKEVLSHRNDQVSCNELARECISFTYSHFPNLSIRFETELSDAECIQTNHLYLMRTLRELLYNSAKYSDGKHITLYVSQTETTIRFIVEDVGPGLPKDLQDLIFKPFIKVDDLSEGLGLGLPLSKRHAISLGGDLLFDTTYTKGCRAIIEIPK